MDEEDGSLLVEFIGVFAMALTIYFLVTHSHANMDSRWANLRALRRKAIIAWFRWQASFFFRTWFAVLTGRPTPDRAAEWNEFARHWRPVRGPQVMPDESLDLGVNAFLDRLEQKSSASPMEPMSEAESAGVGLQYSPAESERLAVVSTETDPDLPLPPDVDEALRSLQERLGNRG